MTSRNFSSVAARATLTSGVGSSSTTWSVSTTTGWPSPPFTVVIDRDLVTEEVAEVTGLAGLNATVTRGVDGSSGVAHTSGAVIEHAVSARDFGEPNSHVNASSGVHGVTGPVGGVPVNKTLAADATITVTSYADVPGMTTTLAAGSYDVHLRLYGNHTSGNLLTRLNYTGTTDSAGYAGQGRTSAAGSVAPLIGTITGYAATLAASGAGYADVTQRITVSTSGTLSLQAQVSTGSATLYAGACSFTVTKTQ